jgi:hypothetical protein
MMAQVIHQSRARIKANDLKVNVKKTKGKWAIAASGQISGNDKGDEKRSVGDTQTDKH